MDLVRRIFTASWGQIVAALVLLLSFRFYSASLGPEGFGLAMLGLGMVSLLDGLGSMAFAQILAQVLKDHETRAGRIGLALGLGIRFGLWYAALYCVGLVLAWFWFGALSLVWLAPVVVIFCLCEVPRAAGMTLVMLERRLGLLSSWNALEALAVLGTSLAWLTLTGQNPVALVLGALSGRALVTLILAPAALGDPRQWPLDRATARLEFPRALAFGWSVMLMTPLGWLGAFGDRYIVGAMTGLVEAGTLAALAGAVMRPYGVISAGLTNLFRPDLLDEAAGRVPAHARPLQRWLVIAAAIGLCGIGGFAVLGPFIADFLIRFPTPGIDRGLVVTILAASQMIVLMAHAFENRVLATGRSGVLLGAQSASLAFGLPLVGLGAALGGAEGAAMGRFGAEILRMTGAALLVRYGLKARRSRGGAALQ